MATYPHFNLIDEHGKITKRKEDFERFLKESNAFSEENFFVVSVMGGQSGGKSTLLNILFETEFPVLQMGQRKATTKGVMISFARNLEKNLIVLDLEGSDSTEKTESESETFSRKSALFALAVSEILIVNIWSHDVGKRSAMNLSILRSIFEVNLKLTASETVNKTTILFVLRDYDAKLFGPLSQIEKIVTGNLENIWKLLDKPSQYQSTDLNKLFKFRFFGLPHKEYKLDNFLQKAYQLKGRFKSNEPESYYAKEHYQKTKDVPISAMYQYFCSLWDSVKSFKELNISSQKESLTNNLCENYYEKSLETFRLSQNDLIGGDIDKFAKIGGQIVSKAMESFDEKAFPSGFRTANNKNKSNTVMENGEEIDYIDQIRYKWRKKLLGAIALQVKEIQKSKIDQLLVQLTERYKNELEKEMTEKNKTINDFGKKREETLVATKRAFAEGVLKLSIKEYVEVQLDKTIVEKIMNEMVRKVDLFCFEVLSRLFEDSLIRMTKEKLYLIRKTVRGGKQKMWGTIHEQRTDLHKNANFHIARFEKIWPDNKDFCSKWDNFRNNIQKRVLEEVVDELVRQSDFIYQILNERFNQLFRLDENGRPRNWRREKSIDAIWTEAKEKCEEMLETFSVIKDGPQIGKYPVIEEDRKLLINKEKKKIILKDFQAMALSSLREAEIQKLSNKTNIPIWYYLLLIVLGFDKFLWFANNSYLLIFLIIGGFLWVNYGDSNIANLRFLAKDRLMSIFGSGNNETIK